MKFAYDPNSEVGGVSASVYSFQDPVELYVNKYVVAALAGVQDPGMPSVADIKDEIEGFVRNQKKGEALKAKISGSDLNAIANLKMIFIFDHHIYASICKLLFNLTKNLI